MMALQGTVNPNNQHIAACREHSMYTMGGGYWTAHRYRTTFVKFIDRFFPPHHHPHQHRVSLDRRCQSIQLQLINNDNAVYLLNKSG